ncbi:putative L-asparaginase precursor [Rosellinia necatrix]|uniref:Putative L-asparaginase n=1 Tax=Rosellinia necatrix TaxID=77044 RepID=A0A1W2TJM6_ROSNE|nr:putative L-asparaginase precursor [Rosellinia necatrix]
MAPVMAAKVKPRIIIHGGAGNIKRESMSADQYQQYRHSLLSIITSTDAYMQTPKGAHAKSPFSASEYPSALEIATYAVVKLENDPLFNSGHGAVFTRDGINELEASVMVSRGFAKRGVGVTGLRTVKNPILLAKAMLEHGDKDLLGGMGVGPVANGPPRGEAEGADLDVPSAQGHTLVHGKSAEALAKQYRLEAVDPSYFYTQKRWDDHIRGLERERQGKGYAHWSADEYLPQGTCGAVALDENGVVCVATSTGGITNKLTGRIGDTPVVGAGFWAEEWSERGDPSAGKVWPAAVDPWARVTGFLEMPGPIVQLSSTLYTLFADCLPTPFVYSPIAPQTASRRNYGSGEDIKVIRSTAVSGTGNGDSFLRIAAARSVASIARWASVSASDAVNRVVGRGGELQQSAGPRWGKVGEGEGGMIGIECAIAKDKSGAMLYSRSEILQDHNCAGMFRAWIRDDGLPEMKIWHGDEDEHSEAGLVTVPNEKYES